MPDITGNYSFRIWKEDDWYLAEGEIPTKNGKMLTQGRNAEEIFVMVGDAYATLLGVKVGWWNRLLARLMRYN